MLFLVFLGGGGGAWGMDGLGERWSVWGRNGGELEEGIL